MFENFMSLETKYFNINSSMGDLAFSAFRVQGISLKKDVKYSFEISEFDGAYRLEFNNKSCLIGEGNDFYERIREEFHSKD